MIWQKFIFFSNFLREKLIKNEKYEEADAVNTSLSEIQREEGEILEKLRTIWEVNSLEEALLLIKNQ